MQTDKAPENSKPTSAANLRTQISDYWKAYGGLRAVYQSPFFWMSLILTVLTFGLWRDADWWILVLQIVPTLLGLSLAALTLFLGAGSEAFRELIAGTAEGSEDRSPFFKTAAVFIHFLIMQTLSLFIALLAGALYKLPVLDSLAAINEVAKYIFWCVGYFFFIYSLSTVLAAAFAVFEVVHWFDLFVGNKKNGVK